MTSDILRLDATGKPQGWNSYREAAILYARGAVIWTLGNPFMTLRGGISALTGEQTLMDIHPIIAASGHAARAVPYFAPKFSKMAVYRRDRGICMYCALELGYKESTLDHVTPRSHGGAKTFDNIVLSCLHCNRRKRNQTPEEAGMELMALPYTPNLYENLILGAKRKILGDQMDFLMSKIGKNSRLISS